MNGREPIWRIVLRARSAGQPVYDVLLEHGVEASEAEAIATADEPLYDPVEPDPTAVYEGRLRTSKMPPEYAECTFDSFIAFDDGLRRGKMLAFYTCRQFVAARGRAFTLERVYRALRRKPPTLLPARNSVVLYGNLGVGKTGLAASVANALMAKDKPVVYARAQDIISSVWATYRKDYRGRGRDEIVAFYRSVPLLIIDEMGGEHEGSRDRRDIMEDILRPRASAQLPVLVTTNHTPHSFEDEWGGRTADKLLERAHWIPMGGESLRQKWQPDAEDPL